MADVDVLSDITRKARYHTDHSKVVVCYNSSLASDEAKADAYIAARSLNADHKYAVALGAAGARTQATIWQTWASDLADYCIDNNIEAICCTPSFDAAFVIDGLGYSQEDRVSASRFLGYLPNFKSLEEAQGENPLTSTIKFYKDTHFISILQTRPSVGLSNLADDIAGVVLKDTFGVNDVLGLDSGDTLSINSVDSGAFSGIGNSTSNMQPADLTYRGDIRSAWTTLPNWRIGWYDLTAGVSECTPALITAMVERAIANEGSIGAHKYRPIVCGSRDRGFDAFSVGAPVWNDILYEELGFNNRKWGWAESGLNSGEFEPATSGSVPEATGYSRYDKNDGENYVGFVLRTSAPADTSASVYRNTRSEYGSPTDYHWEALNDTTFPIPVFALHDQLLTNIISGTDSLQFKPSDPIQVFDVQDGAYAYFSTSTGLRSGNTFIEYGGCAAFGSYFEPLADQVRSDGAWTKALLQGYSASQAALFAQEKKLLHVPELIGDGLYRPYKFEAENENTGMTVRHYFDTDVDNVNFDARNGTANATDIAGNVLFSGDLSNAGNFTYGTFASGLMTDAVYPTGQFSSSKTTPLMSHMDTVAGFGNSPGVALNNMCIANVKTTSSGLYGIQDSTTELGFCFMMKGDFVGEEVPFEEINFLSAASFIAYRKADFKTGVAATYGGPFTLWFLSSNANITSGFGNNAKDLSSAALTNPPTSNVRSAGYIEGFVNPNSVGVGGGGGSSNIISNDIIS